MFSAMSFSMGRSLDGPATAVPMAVDSMGTQDMGAKAAKKRGQGEHFASLRQGAGGLDTELWLGARDGAWDVDSRGLRGEHDEAGF